MIRTGKGNSDPIKIRRDIRQMCVLSPYLFNLYTEIIFLGIERETEGVSLGGRRVSNLRYTDDIGIMAKSEEELQTLPNRVNEEKKNIE